MRFVAKPLMGVPAGARWPWERQFPAAEPYCDGVEFLFDDGPEDYDVLAVFGDLPADELEVGPAVRRVFVASEPPSYQRYSPRFLEQFDLVLTTDARTRHPNVLLTQCGNPWHVGMWRSDGSLSPNPLGVDELRRLRPTKDRLISVITSAKSILRGHRSRIAFVLAMKRHFGDALDVYGKGIADVPDKLAALARYRFHLAIENSAIEHYWTEKLADPVLTLTLPIYHGAPNLGSYLPTASFVPIDIRDPAGAIEAISRVLASAHDEVRTAAQLAARERVLTTHNLFSLLARAVRDRLPAGVTAAPHRPPILRRHDIAQPLRERAVRLAAGLADRKLSGRLGHARVLEALRREAGGNR